MVRCKFHGKKWRILSNHPEVYRLITPNEGNSRHFLDRQITACMTLIHSISHFHRMQVCKIQLLLAQMKTFVNTNSFCQGISQKNESYKNSKAFVDNHEVEVNPMQQYHHTFQS